CRVATRASSIRSSTTACCGSRSKHRHTIPTSTGTPTPIAIRPMRGYGRNCTGRCAALARPGSRRALTISLSIDNLPNADIAQWLRTVKRERQADWDRLKALALSLGLPGVEETTSYRQPTLKAHGKLWVWWSPHEDAPVFKVPFEERDVLVEA